MNHSGRLEDNFDRSTEKCTKFFYVYALHHMPCPKIAMFCTHSCKFLCVKIEKKSNRVGSVEKEYISRSLHSQLLHSCQIHPWAQKYENMRWVDSKSRTNHTTMNTNCSHKKNKPSSSSSSSLNILSSPEVYKEDFQTIKMQKVQKVRLVESELSIFQRIEKKYEQWLGHQT